MTAPAAPPESLDVVLANPRGFCAGVDRAIAIVEQAIAQHGAPIYVRHEVVHNRTVVEGLKAKGAVFVDELDAVPRGATVVFSAHGVSKAVRADAEARGLTVFDATCPLVTKVHVEIAKMHGQGREIVMIGHRGHPEVEGTMGQLDGGVHLVESVADVERLVVADPERLAYVTQTTLSVDDAAAIVDALKRRFPAITGPRKDDICYATQNRQDAVKAMARAVDLVIVVGSPNSSNSNRLREVAANRGVHAYMIGDASELDPAWVAGRRRVGVTAGASAPEVLVRGVIERLRELGARSVAELGGTLENVVFALPAGLRGAHLSKPPETGADADGRGR
ncbi:MAG: 4-hydroxy-3-methylbut-2-enyl diphosphate reductase [Burkholderiales bacterium]|nr:4-hydroxy-3-methylbut-2-enyl diphosphate reductase [Burkholderiales bacterium]MCE7876107.1 4-hydroxy-3-methylbut-2-enyl diphosphate reductase [Betaproteobacteria bacterium PRO3]